MSTQKNGIHEEVNTGVNALLNLAVSQLTTRGTEPLYNIGRAYGVLTFLSNVVFGVQRDNVIFEKAMLEGIELANVYSSHFGKDVAGRYWLSLHSEDPRNGSESLIPARIPIYMIDVAGNGEVVNISDVEIDVTAIEGESLKYVAIWDSETDGVLVDAGEFQVPLDLDGRKDLCFSAGGIRTDLGQ